MTSKNNTNLQYPIGKYCKPNFSNPEILKAAIADIKQLPELLKNKISALSESDLEAEYRQNSWTIREIIHHLAESHTHTYIRFKWALTENEPLIKPYNEQLSASLGDYDVMPVSLSLQFLDNLHQRLGYLVDTITPLQFDRQFTHPEWDTPIDLKTHTTIYAWHGKHHLAHIDLAISSLE